MSKKSGDARRGIDWMLVSQNVAIGVAIVILSQLAWTLRLSELPLVGVLFAGFMPVAFVVIMTYFRSEQRSRGQAIAEGIFAGFVFLVVITLVSGLLSFLGTRGT